MPIMQFPVATNPMPGQQAAPRLARSDMYLPPMPEMLNAPAQTALPQRYAQRGAPESKPAGNSNLVIRAQAGDEPAPKRGPGPVAAAPPKPAPPMQAAAKLSMPSPEELGLAAA